MVEDSCSSSNTNIVIYIDKPQQPVIDFARDKEKRRFQAQWYNEFSWLEYEISRDTAFCFICKQYPFKDKEKATFKSSGFNDWHNAKNFLKIHDSSDSHTKNKMLLLNRLNVEK